MRKKAWGYKIRRLLSAVLAAIFTIGMTVSRPVSALAAERGVGAQWIYAQEAGVVTETTSVSPKDDFYTAVNKDWLLSHEIRPGRTMTGIFRDLDEVVSERMKGLISDKSITGHDAELVRDAAYILGDWETRNAQGVSLMQPYIDAIRRIQSMEELTAYLSNPDENFSGDTLFGFMTATQLDYPENIVVDIYPMGLMLGDSAEYTNRTAMGDIYEALYTSMAEYMLPRFGFTKTETEVIISDSFGLEADIAPYIKTDEESYRSDYLRSLDNNYQRRDLPALAGNLPILTILDGWGYGDSHTYLVEEPEALKGAGLLYTEENLETIKHYLLMLTAVSAMNVTDRAAFDVRTMLLNRASGAAGRKSDDEILTEYLQTYVPTALDNMYIRQYCTAQMKADVTRMIQEVIDAYRNMLREEDWLSEATRAEAIEKLDNITVNAVYPDRLPDNIGLHFPSAAEGGSVIALRSAVRKFNLDYDRSRINTNTKKEWPRGMSASTVNAYYNSQDNSINILAGILSGEIYSESMSWEEKLGSVGMIIGHEISHAFDPNGAQFDKDGRFASWWSDEDYAAFEARAAKLVNYYGRIVPYTGGENYNGEMIKGEAVADMGGMKATLAVAKRIPGFDYARYFTAYARIWCTKMTPQAVMQAALRDVHPLDALRVNTVVQQFTEFYDAFDIRPGDGMYLAPEDRVAVW